MSDSAIEYQLNKYIEDDVIIRSEIGEQSYCRAGNDLIAHIITPESISVPPYRSRTLIMRISNHPKHIPLEKVSYAIADRRDGLECMKSSIFLKNNEIALAIINNTSVTKIADKGTYLCALVWNNV